MWPILSPWPKRADSDQSLRNELPFRRSLYGRERDTSRRDDQYSKAEANTIPGHGGSQAMFGGR